MLTMHSTRAALNDSLVQDTRVAPQRRQAGISILTPTYRRPAEIAGLLENLRKQTFLPSELIVVDGAPEPEKETENVIRSLEASLPFRCRYVRHSGGTAVQRNVALDLAACEFFAFIDDDIRLEPDYFARILEVYEQDTERTVGGVAGYIRNQHLDPEKSPRWRWYRRLRLFKTYEPGRYDYATGYPINRYLQAPHDGLREIDFMGSNCGVWRSEVFANGLRFDSFFRDYGVLEDAHLALRARRAWKLLECGRARCVHLRAAGGRVSKRKLAWKTAVNYRYVFIDIEPERSWAQEFRFWRVQFFDLFRVAVYALRSGKRDEWQTVIGKACGIVSAWRLKPDPSKERSRA